MRCLVFEPNHQGHRFNFLRHLLPAVVATGAEVTLVTTRDALASPQFDEHVRPLSSNLEIDTQMAIVADSPWRLAVRRVRDLAGAIERLHPDHVFVPAADGMVQVTGLRRAFARRLAPAGVELEALMLRGRFGYPPRHPRDRITARLTLAAMARSPWHTLHQLDPMPYEAIQRRGGALAARTALMPEPVERIAPVSREDARRRLGLPVEGRIIGSAGSFHPRKGIGHLLRAFAAARLEPTDRLLLVGRINEALLATIEREFAPLIQAGRLLIVNRFVSDDDFNIALAAMDVIAAPYLKHIGSSGLIVRAPVIGRPVLGSSFGWIGWTIKSFGLGSTCEIEDEPALAAAVAKSLADAASYRRTDEAERFSQFHTIEQFQAAWVKRLRERQGLPALEMLEWESLGVCDSA